MLTLSAKIRKISGKKTKTLREKGLLPAVVYGPKIEALSLELDYKKFRKIYKESGESSLISLEVEDKKEKSSVLIHDVQRDPLSDEIIHVDFYQVPLAKEVEAKVPLIFEGEPLAVKELGGTLVKDISELEVKSLPQRLPKEIRVDTSKLKTFEDRILIKDLNLPEGVKILKNLEEVVANVSPPAKVEEELEKPIEEKVEDVERVEKKEEETKEVEETTKK